MCLVSGRKKIQIKYIDYVGWSNATWPSFSDASRTFVMQHTYCTHSALLAGRRRFGTTAVRVVGAHPTNNTTDILEWKGLRLRVLVRVRFILTLSLPAECGAVIIYARGVHVLIIMSSPIKYTKTWLFPIEILGVAVPVQRFQIYGSNAGQNRKNWIKFPPDHPNVHGALLEERIHIEEHQVRFFFLPTPCTTITAL